MSSHAVEDLGPTIKEEFRVLRAQGLEQLARSGDVRVARRLLRAHLPELVSGRAQVLFDSLLNRLMGLVIQRLSRAPAEVKSRFYSLDLRRQLRERMPFGAPAFQPSPDRRLIAGGVAGAATLVGGAIVAACFAADGTVRTGLGVATLVASAAAYGVGYWAGRTWSERALERDVARYVREVEARVVAWLHDVEGWFEDAVRAFTAERRCGGSSSGSES
ncbi:MAG: hypothetical protein RMK74_12855 [Myxococcales bacterium]|nr:hypothetical protein [Myxococcales bacterium]